MKSLFMSAVAATFMLFSCAEKKAETPVATETPAPATETETPVVENIPDSVKMQNWQAYATPGDVHKMMASWDGKWKESMLSWKAPGATPDTMVSESVVKSIMDGRYSTATYKGMMMGMPFEGLSTMAWDNQRKVFINTWIDNFGTGLTVLEGPWDEATKTINLSGKMVDPSYGDGRMMNYRQVVTIIDDKTQKVEMYFPGPDGKEFKNMEIVSTRI